MRNSQEVSIKYHHCVLLCTHFYCDTFVNEYAAGGLGIRRNGGRYERSMVHRIHRTGWSWLPLKGTKNTQRNHPQFQKLSQGSKSRHAIGLSVHPGNATKTVQIRARLPSLWLYAPSSRRPTKNRRSVSWSAGLSEFHRQHPLSSNAMSFVGSKSCAFSTE
jgi:hypothetical protein